MTDDVIVRRVGGLAWIGFNRPARRNAMPWYCYSPNTIATKVTAIANEFATRAPLTLQASKALVGRVQAQRRASIEAGDDWVTACYMSDDFKAAVNKFVHKTPFEWSGR